MKYLKKFENEHQLEEHSEQGSHYMFFKNIEIIKHCIEEIEKISKEEIGELLDNGHDWAADHITVAKECIQQVSDFLRSENTMDTKEPDINSEPTFQPNIPVEDRKGIELIEDDNQVVESFKKFTK